MDGSGGSASANNSSDFVRKLYKMLEDPSYSWVVRWGDEGDSFVVLENEKFTKSILPKHFKHSNFASFVRQLNKYDFHKVRQNNEEGGTSPYGPNAWEFKHPEFKINNKDSLDNIRRKAPAPRKTATMPDGDMPSQQINLMNQQLVAQSQLLEQLSQRYAELMCNHQMMLQEVLRVQKTVLNHEHVIHNVMTFLHSVDAKQRTDRRAMFNSGETGHAAQMTPTSQAMAVADDEPASPLQQASKLLNELNAETQFNAHSLEHLRDLSSKAPSATSTSPPAETNLRHANGALQSANPSSDMAYAHLSSGELDQVVYPMGSTNGIDPMYGEHVNNIPYPMPAQENDSSDPRRHYPDGKKSTFADPGWTRPPRILLVEDDPTCRQIGGKFLYSFCCVVDSALNGLEAVNKLREGAKYDLVLMDIIMPHLDGVSACHVIRQFDQTPIVAMTSNIRSDDIQMYFQHGMDDVLPKPFTRKSLLEMLERHLSLLKKSSTGMEPPLAAATPSVPLSTTQSIKDDASPPAHSPAASIGNWQSPGQYPGISPIHTNMANQYAQMASRSPYTASPQTPLTARPPIQLPQQQIPVQPTPSHNSQIQPPSQQQRGSLPRMVASTQDTNGYHKRPRLDG